MAAFAGKRMTPGAVPIQAGFAQASAGSDERCVAAKRRSRVQGGKAVRLKVVNAPGMSFKIVDEGDMLNLRLTRELCLVDDPGQVGCRNHAVQYRAGKPECSMVDACVLISKKLDDNLRQSAMLATGIDLFDLEMKVVSGFAVQAEPGVCAADVSRQYHSWIFLHERPSLAIKSVASAGPHEPAG